MKRCIKGGFLVLGGVVGVVGLIVEVSHVVDVDLGGASLTARAVDHAVQAKRKGDL